MDTLPSSERGGFWRRWVALVIDVAIIGVGLQLFGIPAYTLSGGRVQVNILQTAHCQNLSAVPAGLEVPAEFETHFAVECVNDLLFGLPTARWVTISEQPQLHVGWNKMVDFRLDAAGHPLDDLSHDLSNLWTPLLLIYRIIFEWRSGQTIGKRLTRVRVIETHPTTSAVPSAAKRNLAFFLPFLGFPVFELVETPFWYWLVPSVIVSAVIVWQIASRRDTYSDKAAGTQVIRVRRNLPWLAVPTPAA